VLSIFCHDELAPGLKDLDLADLPESEALAVHCNVESDQFIVHVSLREEPITQRGVLSQASQLFDPFGMIQLFVLPIRGCCRDYVSLTSDWTKGFPLQDIWMRWVRALPTSKLQSISIPRWFGFGRDDSQLELHCFSDANGVGYGAVCYTRVVRGSTIHCTFVSGK